MGLLIRLAFTGISGLVTFITKEVPWLAIVGALATLTGLILTILQIIVIIRSMW